jgi:hypothetical protein
MISRVFKVPGILCRVFCIIFCSVKRNGAILVEVVSSRLRFRNVNAADLPEYRDVTSCHGRFVRGRYESAGNCICMEVQMQVCFAQINRAYIIS